MSDQNKPAVEPKQEVNEPVDWRMDVEEFTENGCAVNKN
jgi:hypothetical protein